MVDEAWMDRMREVFFPIFLRLTAQEDFTSI